MLEICIWGRLQITSPDLLDDLSTSCVFTVEVKRNSALNTAD